MFERAAMVGPFVMSAIFHKGGLGSNPGPHDCWLVVLSDCAGKKKNSIYILIFDPKKSNGALDESGLN